MRRLLVALLATLASTGLAHAADRAGTAAELRAAADRILYVQADKHRDTGAKYLQPMTTGTGRPSGTVGRDGLDVPGPTEVLAAIYGDGSLRVDGARATWALDGGGAITLGTFRGGRLTAARGAITRRNQVVGEALSRAMQREGQKSYPLRYEYGQAVMSRPPIETLTSQRTFSGSHELVMFNDTSFGRLLRGVSDPRLSRVLGAFQTSHPRTRPHSMMGASSHDYALRWNSKDDSGREIAHTLRVGSRSLSHRTATRTR